MRQVLFTIPGVGLPLFGYGLLLFIGFLSAMYTAAWRAKREGLDPEIILDIAIWIMIGGLVGARVFFVIQYWGTAVKNIWDVFTIWKGGIVFYGSVIGATSAFFLYWRLRPFPLNPVLDTLAPSVALGVAFGRIGCFLNGCCYGDPTSLPWAVAFPQNSLPWQHQLDFGLIGPHALHSLPVHPTQIYSSIDGLVLFLLLSAFYPLRTRDGQVMALLMITYPVTRFLIEFLRNDEAPILAGMTISQVISIGLLTCGLLWWYRLSRWPAERYADKLLVHD